LFLTERFEGKWSQVNEWKSIDFFLGGVVYIAGAELISLRRS